MCLKYAYVYVMVIWLDLLMGLLAVQVGGCCWLFPLILGLLSSYCIASFSLNMRGEVSCVTANWYAMFVLYPWEACAFLKGNGGGEEVRRGSGRRWGRANCCQGIILEKRKEKEKKKLKTKQNLNHGVHSLREWGLSLWFNQYFQLDSFKADLTCLQTFL